MIHKEGYFILILSGVVLLLVNLGVLYFSEFSWLKKSFFVFSILLYFFLLQFFRNPQRITKAGSLDVVAPVDGKLVFSQSVFQEEYLKDTCYQISIFMSPLNVHITRYPISGKIIYSKYHCGKYLVAWYPKSSDKNERTTVVVEHENGSKILYKQIAGVLARRIVNYAKEGAHIEIGEDSGFIKFGSRLDVLLPKNSTILVKMNQKIIGGETIIARLKQ